MMRKGRKRHVRSQVAVAAASDTFPLNTHTHILRTFPPFISWSTSTQVSHADHMHPHTDIFFTVANFSVSSLLHFFMALAFNAFFSPPLPRIWSNCRGLPPSCSSWLDLHCLLHCLRVPKGCRQQRRRGAVARPESERIRPRQDIAEQRMRGGTCGATRP